VRDDSRVVDAFPRLDGVVPTRGERDQSDADADPEAAHRRF
jgi:hypothetical protein